MIQRSKTSLEHRKKLRTIILCLIYGYSVIYYCRDYSYNITSYYWVFFLQLMCELIQGKLVILQSKLSGFIILIINIKERQKSAQETF